MKKLVLLLGALAAWGQTPDADDILDRVDTNIGSESKVIVARMTVHTRRASRTISFMSWIKGIDQSFTEYLSPAREKGTKMLKLGDELWTYTPDTDRTIKIAGHMLRQSVMGSDMSYEDMMEDPKLTNIYDAAVVGEDTLLDRPCWVLELTATTEDIAYHSRKVWVDKSRYAMLREERYAKGGRLLKTTEVRSMRQMSGRWVTDHVVFKDALKQGQGTEFMVDSLRFNAEIPAYLLSKAALRK